MERIGIVGAGYWGANVAASFEATKRAEIAWFCDTELSHAERLAAQRPRAQITNTLEPILADASVSAIAISTPTVTHYDVAKRALGAGKHVFVEKPITASISQAEELVKIGDSVSRVLMVGHVFEYNASLSAVREIMRSGELGNIYYMNFVRTNLGPVRTDVNALWDLASHDVSIMCFLTGASPVDVTASGKAFLNSDIEDVAFATFSFSDGAKANVHASWLNPRKVREITVVGSRKMLVWDDLDLQTPVRVFDKSVGSRQLTTSTGDFLEHKTILIDRGLFIPNVPINRPLQAECEHFLDCIGLGQRPRSDGRSGLRVVQILEAATRSMRSGGARVEISGA